MTDQDRAARGDGVPEIRDGDLPQPASSVHAAIVRPRLCVECRYWKKDYGIFCMNGWSGMDRDHGHCHVEPRAIPMAGQSTACRFGEAK